MRSSHPTMHLASIIHQCFHSSCCCHTLQFCVKCLYVEQEAAVKTTATCPGWHLWLRPHIVLAPSKPSTSRLLLVLIEYPEKHSIPVNMAKISSNDITIKWYSSCPLMASLTTALMDPIGILSVRSLVPIHNWSASILKVSRTLPPDLLYIPLRGTWGNGSFRFLVSGTISSVLPC